MTSSSPIIKRLRVEAFRGFRDAHEFDLSAAAIVVTGPNGTGKTSFFDALQWGLLGTLERLEVLRSRRNTEHVVNQYRLGQKASVEIDLSLPTGHITVIRTGDHSGSTLELNWVDRPPLFGKDAEDKLRNILLPYSELTIKSALATSGLMQQDVMRHVLEAKPADRYRQLSTVLGLGALEDFQEAATAVAKTASARKKSIGDERDRLATSMERAKVRLEAAKAHLREQPQVAAIREEADGVLLSTPAGLSLVREEISLHEPNDVRLAASAFGDVADRIETARALCERASKLRTALDPPLSEEHIENLRAELAQAKTSRDAAATLRGMAQEQLNTARLAAEEVAQLAALAVPLLSDDCPVCGQHIDRDHVERELRDRAEKTGTILKLQQKFIDASNNFNSTSTAVSTAHEALEAAILRADLWQVARSAQAAADEAVQDVEKMATVVKFDRHDEESFVRAADPAMAYIRRVRRALHDLLEALDRRSEQGAIDRATAEIGSLETAIALTNDQWAEESVRSDNLQNLATQTLSARIEVTETRLRSIQPLVANIFQRLDPHPAFKTVEFELDTYYKQGTTSPLVIDHVANISADPLLIFSTSQANIVALSYFIAMSLSSKERGLPFLLLDDPVQSMDDINVLGFADLCRHLRHHRQIIISTHERRFASLLERKLAPRAQDTRTKVIKFTGWDRSGPTVEEYFVEPQLLEDPIRLVRTAS